MHPEGCANSDVTCDLLVRVGRQLGTLRPLSTLRKLGLASPEPFSEVPVVKSNGRLRSVGATGLGGLLHEYHRAA